MMSAAAKNRERSDIIDKCRKTIENDDIHALRGILSESAEHTLYWIRMVGLNRAGL